MAKADFHPVTDASKLLFLDILVTAVDTAEATVGLLLADITAITTARDTKSPYVDARANLTAGAETRYYLAQFLQKDAVVGEISDVLVVTVPG
jgi:hypothetical protein